MSLQDIIDCTEFKFSNLKRKNIINKLTKIIIHIYLIFSYLVKLNEVIEFSFLIDYLGL